MIHSNTVDDTLAIELDEEQMLEEERIQLAFERVFADFSCTCGDFYCTYNLYPGEYPRCRE
jgi:hypothetical protein